MTILNLTQHPASPEQIDDRCVDLEPHYLQQLKPLLNFTAFPDQEEVYQRAKDIAALAEEQWQAVEQDGDGKCAMIGGAPYLMKSLQEALEELGFEVCYAFSVRESVERIADDGSVIKTSVFKHKGYVFV